MAGGRAIIPAGMTSDAVASMMDVLPTAARLCGAEPPPKPLDGIELEATPGAAQQVVADIQQKMAEMLRTFPSPYSRLIQRRR